MRYLIAICLVFLTGCAGIDKAMTGASSAPSREARESSIVKFPDLSAENKTKFVNGEAWIGMTTQQLAAMWGNEPSKTQKKLTTRGNEETQLYKIRVGDWKTGIKTQFYKVNVLADKVIEIQELDESGFNLERL